MRKRVIAGVAAGASVALRRAKRLLFALAIGYVILALLNRAREAAGLLTCSCYSDCWCKRPGLSLFRWVIPRFHHNPEIEAWKKQLDPSA
jgi:hypothetical protein